MNVVARKKIMENLEIFGVDALTVLCGSSLMTYGFFTLPVYWFSVASCTGASALYGCKKAYTNKKDYKKKMGIYAFNGFLFGISIPVLPYMIPAYVAYKLNKETE